MKMRQGDLPGSSMDAAQMKPRFIPDRELQGRDDSGGLYYDTYSTQFGDGGWVRGGDKPHLTASNSGMKEDPTDNPMKFKGDKMLRRTIDPMGTTGRDSD